MPFLLIVTEVDLASSSLAHALALPSRLTNVAVISTKRLSPELWSGVPDPDRAAPRLAALMLHSFGDPVALDHHGDPTNPMVRPGEVEDLNRMAALTPPSMSRMARTLPTKANERWTVDGKTAFVAATLVRDAGGNARAVVRANPFRLLAKMPTTIAAALSVIVVLSFSAETWDVATAVSVPQVVGYSAMCLGGAAFALYRAFVFDTLLSRDRRLTEGAVVTTAATLLSLAATLLAPSALFGARMWFVILTVFPAAPMDRWPGVGAATTRLDHLKLSRFLAAMGVLAGSLGGLLDSRDLLRGVLFITEET